MAGPQLARSPRKGRVYVWPPDSPDREYPSVTTILSEVAKPAIPYWAAKQVAEFAIDNVDSWHKCELNPSLVATDILADLIEGYGGSFEIGQMEDLDVFERYVSAALKRDGRRAERSGLDRDSALDLLKRAPWRERDRAGNVGRAVHEAIENDDEWVEGDLGGYVQAARSWLSDHSHELLQAEVTVFHDKYQYAGTFDGIIEQPDGLFALVDWKTGKGLWPDSALQMVAYLNAEWRAVQQDGKWVSKAMPEVGHGWLVHLRADGGYEAKRVDHSVRLWKAFVGARSLRAWGDSGERKQFWSEVQTPKKGEE